MPAPSSITSFPSSSGRRRVTLHKYERKKYPMPAPSSITSFPSSSGRRRKKYPMPAPSSITSFPSSSGRRESNSSTKMKGRSTQCLLPAQSHPSPLVLAGGRVARESPACQVSPRSRLTSSPSRNPHWSASSSTSACARAFLQ